MAIKILNRKKIKSMEVVNKTRREIENALRFRFDFLMIIQNGFMSIILIQKLAEGHFLVIDLKKNAHKFANNEFLILSASFNH